MGGCYASGDAAQTEAQACVDLAAGGWPACEASFEEPPDAVAVAISRVVRHHAPMVAVNPHCDDRAAFDEVRAAAPRPSLPPPSTSPPPSAKCDPQHRTSHHSTRTLASGRRWSLAAIRSCSAWRGVAPRHRRCGAR